VEEGGWMKVSVKETRLTEELEEESPSDRSALNRG
jgi:hypothetical protein